MKDSHKEPGTIAKVRIENFRDDGADPNTVNVGIEFKGSYQGFGGLMLPTKALQDAFVNQLMSAFGVRKIQELAGKECFALRSFSTWNSPIVGLESVDTGRRFTISAFRKSQGFNSPTPYEEEVESLNLHIASAERQIADSKKRLAVLASDYVAW
jgi:hypothetical protein